MEPLKYILSGAAILLAVSGRGMAQRDMPSLDEAAYLMYETPDSALSVISEIEPMFDIDGQTEPESADSVANTVFSYYQRHGNKREKFDIYYILGRFHQMRGNEEAAMFCYVNAGKYVNDAADLLLPGCLYSSIGSMYEYGYDYAKAAEYYDKGGEMFLAGEDYQHYTESCIRSAKCCFFMGDEDRAKELLDKIEHYREYIRGNDQVGYFRLLLNMKEDIPLEDIIKAIDNLGAEWGYDFDPGNLLAISDIYLKSGYTDSVRAYLERFSESEPAYTSSPLYYLRLSNLYDTLGLESKALDAYRRHVALKDSAYLDKISENVQLVAAMYDNYERTYRAEKDRRILWYSLVIVVISGTVTVLRFRNKIWRQTRRTRYLEELYRNVSQEKNALENIMKNSVLIDDPTRNVIQNRLVVLDELLTMRRLGDYSPQKASEMIESIAMDQDAYLNSLGLMFSLRHPEMAAYLRKRQFSTWEIGYCSLYCMGYKGKDIGNILSSSRYYKINSEIRKKLGLGPMETNLDIYIRKLMSEMEKS